jgi:transglutaminase-like putative cysteine protease
MHLQISHHTRYEYDREVQLQPHLVYLRPRENPLLEVKRFALTLQPEAQLNWMRDDFDNMSVSALFPRPAATLDIVVESEVVTADLPPFEFLVRDYAVKFPFQYEPLHRFNLGLYLAPPTEATQTLLRTWLDANFTDRPAGTVAWLFALNQTVTKAMEYCRRDEPGIQSAETTLLRGLGSCRDFAVLLIECARTLGVAARFVSGYLYDPAATDETTFSMHAWAEVFIPGAGWRGLDPTHGIFCTNAYIPIAHAVVAESVNPIQGSFFSEVPATAKMTVRVRVKRIDQAGAAAVPGPGAELTSESSAPVAPPAVQQATPAQVPGMMQQAAA